MSGFFFTRFSLKLGRGEDNSQMSSNEMNKEYFQEG